MYSMLAITGNAVLDLTGREQIINILTTKRKKGNCEVICMLISLIMLSISQCICVSKHVEYLKYIKTLSIRLQSWKKFWVFVRYFGSLKVLGICIKFQTSVCFAWLPFLVFAMLVLVLVLGSFGLSFCECYQLAEQEGF